MKQFHVLCYSSYLIALAALSAMNHTLTADSIESNIEYAFTALYGTTISPYHCMVDEFLENFNVQKKVNVYKLTPPDNISQYVLSEPMTYVISFGCNAIWINSDWIESIENRYGRAGMNFCLALISTQFSLSQPFLKATTKAVGFTIPYLAFAYGTQLTINYIDRHWSSILAVSSFPLLAATGYNKLREYIIEPMFLKIDALEDERIVQSTIDMLNKNGYQWIMEEFAVQLYATVLTQGDAPFPTLILCEGEVLKLLNTACFQEKA